MLDSEKKSIFQIQTLLRKAFDKILSENPKTVTIVNESKNNDEWLKQAIYVASVNSLFFFIVLNCVYVFAKQVFQTI